MSINIANMLINNATLYTAKVNRETEPTITSLISLIVDENKFGLGKDSIKFEAKPTITEYDFAGKLDDSYKDMEEITGWNVSLTGDVLDISEKVLEYSCFKKVEDTDTEYVRYEPCERINSEIYKDLIVVGEVKGKKEKIILIIYNTFNEDGLSIEFKDKDNNAASLSFKGKKTLAGEKSFDILIPKVSE